MLQMKYHQCKDKFHIPLGNEYNPWSWGSVTVIISPNYILDSLWVCIFVSLELWVLLRNTSVNEKYLQQKTNLCRATVLNWYFKLWKLRKYFNDQKDIYSFSSVSYLFFLLKLSPWESEILCPQNDIDMGSENIDMEIEVRMTIKEDQMNAQRCTENQRRGIM